MKKAIYLIGFMGSGKSTLGKALAEKLQIPFFDLDDELIKTYHLSIPEMFEQWGEEKFRTQEAEKLREFDLSKAPFVLACGGGTPCFFENMVWMNTNGQTLFLDPPVSILTKRLAGSEDERPVLKKHSQEGASVHWTELLKKRRPFYLQAASRLASGSPKLDEVIHMLNS